MKLFLKYIKNKYILSGLLFLVWMLLFDDNRIISLIKFNKELKDVKSEKNYYLKEIKNNTKLLELLKNNPKELEKYAREKYLMKKDDEDIFLIVFEAVDE